MWMTILLQAILFAVSHLPEIIAALKAIFSFFKANSSNPKMSSWTKDFAAALKTSEAQRSPQPLINFLAKIKAEL